MVCADHLPARDTTRGVVAATVAVLLLPILWLAYLLYLYLVLGLSVAAPYGHPYAVVPMLILSVLWALVHSLVRVAAKRPSRRFFVRAILWFTGLRLLFGLLLAGGHPAGLVLVAPGLGIPLLLGPVVELALSLWAVAVVEAGLAALRGLQGGVRRLGHPAPVATQEKDEAVR